MSARGYLEVSLRDVFLERGGRRILDQIRWRIRPGQRWVLVGANGSGKTQLLKVLAGIVRPLPTSPPTLRWRLNDEWHAVPYDIRQHVAYLGPERQDKYERYAWNLEVQELVGTGLQGTDIPLDPLTRSDRARVRAQLQRLGIAALAGRRFLDLSYGERRMAVLARALIARPRLLLLDEVFAGLDAENHARLLRWLARLRSGLPLVLATHSATAVPAGFTHSLELSGGRVRYCGPLRPGRLAAYFGAHAHAAPSAPRRARAPSRTRAAVAALVRLERASVYLEEHRALSSVTLAVRRGEFWVIHGANGSGKTTLLRTLYGDHGVAVGGSVTRAGIHPGVPLQRFRARTGMAAPHVHARYPRGYTVAEVVLSGLHASIGLHRPLSAGDRRAGLRLLRRLRLDRWSHRTLRELSYGQTRRVLFARAIIADPTLLLLDEPFDSLDARTSGLVRTEVLRLAGQGKSIIVTAHSPQEWGHHATHEVQLEAGCVRYCGPLRAHA